jgi:hypothetical protein
MAMNYHVLQGTSVAGPLQLEELAKLVQKGVVSGQTLVSDDAATWKPASELVPHLFGKVPVKATTSSSNTTGVEQWYVQANGQQYGPITYTELLGWVSSKSVVADTQVRKSEHGTWQRADAVFPHLGARSLAPGSAKPNAAPKTNSPLSIRTDAPPPPPAKEAKPAAPTEESGSGAMVLVGIVVSVVGIYLVVTGVAHLKAAFGFFGIVGAILLVRFFMSLGKVRRNMK